MRHLTVIAFILIVVCHFEMVSQSCLPDGIIFTTQSQIDSFQINHPNCTEIEGDVSIVGYDIVNLDGLSVLTSIGGYIWIENIDSLSSLSGLDNLTSIEGGLVIRYCNALTNLSGLEGLTSIGEDLWVGNNDALTSLSGLEGLTSIEGWLGIGNNDALTSLSGLEGLTSIVEYLSIYDNIALTNLSALRGLTSIGGYFKILDNDVLVSLSGLEGLTSIGGYLGINKNAALTSLSGLDNVTSVGGGLWIWENHTLTSFSGLEGLTSIGGEFKIWYNDVLVSLSGLDNINAESIRDLEIVGNQWLSDCAILSICNYLENPNGDIYIYGNTTGCNSSREVKEACTASISEQQTAIQLSIYPNPFTTSTTIEYELKEISNIQFTIYNVMGETVYHTEFSLMPPGSHTVTWSPSHIPEGLYFAVLRSEEGVSVVKMVKQ